MKDEYQTVTKRTTYKRRTKRKFKYGSKARINVYIPKITLNKLIAEAAIREWPLSRLIVHFCELSLERIE